MTDPKREDWSAIISRLERYYRHLDIGEECGHSERWVGMLKSGEIKQPGHWEGEKLKSMDHELVLKAAQQETSIPDSIRA